MMDRPTLRRPKLHFEVGPNPSHVTFDDGQNLRRNLPWFDYEEARWEYRSPDGIAVQIGGWLVQIRGHNLDPLFAAIEEQTLMRLRARPALEEDAVNQADTFATAIQFLKPVVEPVVRRRGQMEIELGD